MKYERLYAKVKLDAIDSNISFVRNKISTQTNIMAVVKADAYGHGAVEIARHILDKVDWFGVSNIDEALELRNNGIDKPILILGASMPDEFESIIKNNITCTLFDIDRALELSRTAIRLKKSVDVHIKLDTGMSRIGFCANYESVNEIIQISKLPRINITGIFSHFAKADEEDKSYTYKQKELFDWFIKECAENGIKFQNKHLSNSAGIIDLDCEYDMVRMGIMLYGLMPSDEMLNKPDIKPALELITHITHIKNVNENTGISYGHTYTTSSAKKIATIPVGYADGYPRCLSNKGYVIISGQKCSIVGRICMDQMMIDVTDVDCIVGDDVILLGSTDGLSITAEEIGNNAHSFNYEFVCGVSRRVPRVYFDNDRYIKTVSYIIN